MTDANRQPSFLTVAGLLVVMALSLSFDQHVSSANGQAGSKEQQPAVPDTVILELFTSQGCSSCPAADRLLRRLGTKQMIDGVTVIPLAFHVDYWNYIGWTDPFSSKEWSERQERYALAFGLTTLYTPQLVINGRHELVGSDERRVRHAIPVAAATGSAALLDLTIDPETLAGGPLRVELRTRLDEDLAADRVEAILVVFENGLVTPVKSGENAQRTLRNEFVVRKLFRVFELPGSTGGKRKKAVDLELDPDWKPSNLGIAAFLQDPESLVIHGASAIFLKDYL